TRELVFNAHAHYDIPSKDIGLLAKTVELLRLAPSETMSFAGPALDVTAVSVGQVSYGLPASSGEADRLEAYPTGTSLSPASYSYQKDNPTALVVPLPREVGPGESVTVELQFTVRVPNKKGRWGQWGGITTLAQWLPVLAFYDEKGWQPAPF